MEGFGGIPRGTFKHGKSKSARAWKRMCLAASPLQGVVFGPLVSTPLMIDEVEGWRAVK